MKLEPDGNGGLRAEVPQTIYKGKAPILDDEGVTEKDIVGEIYALRINDAGNSYEADKAKKYLYFSLNDGTIELTDGQVMGFVEQASGEWIGYCDYNTRWENLKEPTVNLPADAYSRAEDYFISYNNGQLVRDARPTKVAIYDDAVYILIREGYPDLWLQGNVEGDRVVIPACEYLGYHDNIYPKHLFVMPVSYELLNDDGVWYNHYTPATNDIVFHFDSDKRTLRTDDSFIINSSKYQVLYLSDYCELEARPLRTVAERPENPKISYFHKYFVEDGWGMVEFQQAPLTETGEYLDVSDMFFNVYFDDELITFTPGEYIYLKEPITDVPLYFTEATDPSQVEPDFAYEGLGQQVCYYRNDVERLGVQTFYYHDGKKLASDIIYTDGSVVSSIEGVSTREENTYQTMRYYDLQGREVSQPQHGIFIGKQGNVSRKCVMK